MKKAYVLFLILFLSNHIFSQTLPFKREFRGIWIATTKMIDYPSKPNLSSSELKKEFIDLIEFHKNIGFNAVVFQIRPAADAFYDSPYEPWSEWLTGKQGRAPTPYFDPLKFMIEECHKRNIEFHAWFNPFRAVATIEFADVCAEHITNTKPEWFIKYDINKYFNPGIPEVRNYLIKIIMDVVNRYDIDGVHFDDYFYPYPKRDDFNKIMDFGDENTFLKYKKDFNDKGDWRRNNLDLFVKELYTQIKQSKPWVKFGVGPGGVWRNKMDDPRGSDTKGLGTYDWLYADIIKWLQNGWIDYVAPQIYWNINHSLNDFNHLVNWWVKNSYGRNLYIGLGVYRLENPTDKAWKNPNEIPNQLRIAQINDNVHGSIHYRSTTYKLNPLGVKDSIRKLYSDTVYFPEMPWATELKPNKPEGLEKIRIENEFVLYWDENISDSPVDSTLFYIVYRLKGKNTNKKPAEKNFYAIIKQPTITIQRQKRWQIFGQWYSYIITSFNKFHVESEPSNSVSIKFKN